MLLKDSVEFQTLIKQGYPEEMILLAIQESDTKSYGEVSDILYSRKEHYRKILGMDNLKDTKKTKAKEKKSQYFQAGRLASSQNKDMDKHVVVFLEKMIQDLKKKELDDPNEYQTKLAGYIEEIAKGETNQTMKLLWNHLWSGYEHPLILELRNVIFFVFSRVITSKRNVEVNQKMLEFCLENSFGLRLMTYKQMSSLMGSCKELNAKTKFWDAEFFDRLDECSEGFDWANPWHAEYLERSKLWAINLNNENEKDEEKKVSDEQKEKLIAKATAKKKRREMQEQRERADEERKYQLVCQLKPKNNEVFESSSEVEAEEKKEPEEKKAQAMEECLICMKNIREIVFLPCCHFLTCSDCSLKVNKCPVCSQAIEKNQKIYWS